MALYSLVVEHGGKHYGTQVEAPSAQSALEHYFDIDYPVSGLALFGESAPLLSAKDIIHVTPMDPLINMWVGQAGRDGVYVSVICSRTMSRRGT